MEVVMIDESGCLQAVSRERMIYQPMPASQPNCLLDDAMQANQDGLGSVVAGDDHFGVPRKDRQPLVTDLLTAGTEMAQRACLSLQLHYLQGCSE